MDHVRHPFGYGAGGSELTCLGTRERCALEIAPGSRGLMRVEARRILQGPTLKAISFLHLLGEPLPPT